ncbi:MAG TPA: anti-sigma factor antagonist [Ruminococcaceae bacterium]|nr:anti-sigma factor antagonist [Oscillospiraceae bacterium]
MKVEKSADGTAMTVALTGEVDSLNINEIEEELLKEVEGVKDLTFDMKELEYISSAGLRVLLQMQKMMKDRGSMVIRNTNEEVMGIFKVTGFVKLLNFEH